MNEFWRNLIVSISVLALSGVSYLAFAEPPIYRVLFFVLVPTMALGCLGGMIWTSGVVYAERDAKLAVLGYKPDPPKELPFGASWALTDAIEVRVKKLKMPVWVLPIFVVTTLYLDGLLLVPMLRDMLEKPVTTIYQPSAPQPKHQVP